MADTRLLDFADTLLDEVVIRLNNAGITVPDHRYIHSGNWAADLTEENCADALLVTFDGIIQGGSSGAAAALLPGTPIKCAVPLVAAYTVALIRCVPALTEDGDAPSPAALSDSATELLVDAMELTKAVIDIYLGDTCALKSIGGVVPIGPEGAAGGHSIQVFTELA